MTSGHVPTHSGHMPTLPFSESESHQHRQAAESFGSDAELYDRARPRYPDAMVEAIIAASPGPDLLDVGMGTGISARPFQAAGCKVLGVDVDPRMAAFARHSGLDAEVATFEAWDPAGRTFDAVTAGQTWHWIDPVAGAAKAAEVLRPGGRLAVFWNVFRPSPEIAKTFSEVHRRVMPDSQRNPWAKPAIEGYSVLFTNAADGIRQTSAFGDPQRWQFNWERPYLRDEWLDQLRTGGDASQIPPTTLEELLEGIGAAIDALGGTFTMHYTAVVVTAARAHTHQPGAAVRPLRAGQRPAY
ncbi:methyltransferase type 11 [Streptomyces aurantiogriseus]|uniref:Methyltransferase type 11 n=2 Tax=Streptomyces aurantiogriseus TaxID=66870 RepID=A0A918FL76_9ACTN|nr:methyltransferase type 11 [Streptomyces aurantiogriseus]